MESLNEIGVRCGTDKSSMRHGFLDLNELHLAHHRDKPVTLLESGVFKGQSLAMSGEYFPNGRVVGVDTTTIVYAGANRSVEIADQSDVDQLMRLATKYGPFDIIVDDASHRWDHQLTSLRHFYPFVKLGGFYILEDTHTSCGILKKDYNGFSDITAANYIGQFTDAMMGGEFFEPQSTPDDFIRGYALRTAYVSLGHNGTAIFRRK